MSREKLFSVSISDCVVQTFRAGGKGGQHQNKTDSGVRIIHEPSGARGESREERSQLQNKRIAFAKMAKHPRFIYWVHAVSNGLKTQAEIDKELAEMMSESNIITEIKDKGQWITVDPNSLN